MQRKKDIDKFWNENKRDVSLVQNKIDELQKKHARHAIVKHYFATSSYQGPRNNDAANLPENAENTCDSDMSVDEDVTVVEVSPAVPEKN